MIPVTHYNITDTDELIEHIVEEIVEPYVDQVQKLETVLNNVLKIFADHGIPTDHINFHYAVFNTIPLFYVLMTTILR